MIEFITTDQILALKEKLTPYKRYVHFLAHTQLDTVRKLQIWVTSLSDTPRLQYYDVQTLEF